MIYRVHVGVALERPLKSQPDEYRRVVVEARNPLEGELIACQIAACTSVMPTWAEIQEE